MKKPKEITLTKDQMIDVFHAWNKQFMEEDPTQLREIDDSREYAESQTTEFLEIFDKLNS